MTDQRWLSSLTGLPVFSLDSAARSGKIWIWSSMVVTFVNTRYCLNYGLIWSDMVVTWVWMVVIWSHMVMPFTNVRYFQKLIVVGWSHMVLTFGHLVLTRNTIHSDRNISNAFTVDRVIHYRVDGHLVDYSLLTEIWLFPPLLPKWSAYSARFPPAQAESGR